MKKKILSMAFLICLVRLSAGEAYHPDFSFRDGDPVFGKGELWVCDHGQRIAVFRTENSLDAGGQKLAFTDLKLQPSGKSLFWWIKFGLTAPYKAGYETGTNNAQITFITDKPGSNQKTVVNIAYDESKSGYVYDFIITREFAKGETLPRALSGIEALPTDIVGGHHNNDRKYTCYIVEEEPDRFIRVPQVAGNTIGGRTKSGKVRKLPSGGIIAYVDERSFEDTIAMRNMTPDSLYYDNSISSCAIDFNDSIIFGAAVKEPLDKSVTLDFHYSIFMLPKKESEGLYRKAELAPVAGDGEPLYAEGVNDFETTVDYSRYSLRWLRRWLLLSNACLDNAQSHSGQCSVRVGSKEKGGVCMLHSGYFGLDVVGVNIGKTYEYSAWVKTEGIKGKAWIGYMLCRWNPSRSFDPGWIKVGLPEGTNDWQKVSTQFKVDNTNHFNVGLALGVDGEGTAWFDDVQLKEIKDEYVWDNLDLAELKNDSPARVNFKLGKDIALLSEGTKVAENIRLDPGAEEAIDGDEHGILWGGDYWGNYPYGFVLDFGRPREIGKVEIRWYSDIAYGTDWRIEYFDGKSWYLLKEEKDWMNNPDYLYAYVLPAPVAASKIRFLLLNAAGGESLHMRRFSLFEALDN